MGTKKSVDEIWRELNAKPVPRSRSSGIPGFGIPGITTHTRVVGAKQPQQAPGAAALDTALHVDVQRRGVTPYDAAQAGVDPQELQAYVATMQRTVNCLTDAERSTRKGAVQALRRKLLQGDAATPRAAPAVLQALLCGQLLQPLVVLLHDPVELCRTATLQLLTEAVPQLPDVGPLLAALLPQLAARLTHLPLAEPSEEARLQVAELAAALAEHASASQLVAVLPDLELLLVRTQGDAYPAVLRAGAAAAVSVAAKLGAALEPHSERLLQALLPGAAHAHSRVRLAVVAAVDAVVAAEVPAGAMERLVAPGVRPLLLDHAPAVREAAFVAVAHWLGAAGGGAGGGPGPGERARAHGAALLALLLLGVSDAQPSVAERALALVEAVGAAYAGAPPGAAAEGAAAPASRDAAVAAAADPMEVDTSPRGNSPGGPAPPAAEPGPSASQRQLDGGAGDEDGAAATPAAVAAARLPPPYSGLPGEGVRAMVRALLPRLLPPLLLDLREWTVSTRLAAARTLHTCLVCAGAGVDPHLPLLAPALCAAAGDDDAAVAAALRACVRVLGALAPPRRVLPLLADALDAAAGGGPAGGRGSDAARANALVVVAGVLTAAADAERPAEPALVAALAHALAREELRGSDHPGVRMQLLSAARGLLRWARAAAGPVAPQLYALLLQLHGGGGTDLAAAAAAEMQALAAAAGVEGGAAGLAAAHAGGVFDAAAAGSAEWAAGAPAVEVVLALMRTGGAAPLGALLPRLTEVLGAIVGDPEREGALRLALLQAVDALLEDEALRDAAAAGDNAHLLLERVLLPPLVWRAGKTAAAVRFAAVTALATLLRARLAPPRALAAALGAPPAPPGRGGGGPKPPVAASPGAPPQLQLLPLLLQCLDEDWYADVRLTSAYCLSQLLDALGPASLSEAHVVALYPELLKRLDDSSNTVRVAAAGAIAGLAAAAGPGGLSATHAGYLTAGAALHMDDSDADVAEAAARALEAVAALHPGAVAAEVAKARPAFRAKHYCDRVLARCGGGSGGGGGGA